MGVLMVFSPLPLSRAPLKGVWWTISFLKVHALNICRSQREGNRSGAPFRAGVELLSKHPNVNLPLIWGKSQSKRRFSFLSTFSPLPLKGVWMTITAPKAAAVNSILANMNPVRGIGQRDTNDSRSPFRAGVRSQSKQRLSFPSLFSPLALSRAPLKEAPVRVVSTRLQSPSQARTIGTEMIVDSPFRAGVKSPSKQPNVNSPLTGVEFPSKQHFYLSSTKPLLP
jgi:hypothetical protein